MGASERTLWGNHSPLEASLLRPLSAARESVFAGFSGALDAGAADQRKSPIGRLNQLAFSEPAE